MSGYPPAFLSGGPDHEIARGAGGTFTLKPRGENEGALKAFQHVIRDVERAEASGVIEILKTHESGDHGVGLIDIIVIRVVPA